MREADRHIEKDRETYMEEQRNKTIKRRNKGRIAMQQGKRFMYIQILRERDKYIKHTGRDTD